MFGRFRKDRSKARQQGVRFFRAPSVKLIRLGREMVFRGAYGRLDMDAERVEILDADITAADTQLKAKRLVLDLAKNELAARGEVRIGEGRARLEGDALTARPSLGGMKFEGKFHLFAGDRETAEELLKSGRL